MNDYINRLARGQYIYRKPKLEARDGSIDLSVVAGEISENEFVLSSDNNVKDIIFSSNPKVKLNNGGFVENEQIIKYHVDARECVPGDVIDGKFNIVSNAGEMDVSYVFHVEEKYFDTSLGKAYNLFHFANLVHSAPDEAVKIFTSDRFTSVFIGNDEHLKNVYESLCNQKNVYVAIEEFLLVIRKKTQVLVELDDEKRVFDDFVSSIKESITITKNTWGYMELDISSDASFIKLETQKINSDEFIGGKYKLEYLIDKSKMHAGKNFGKICISNFYQHFEIEIEVHNSESSDENIDLELFPENAKEIKNAKCALTKAYLDYRMKKKDMQSWISKSNQILDRIRGIAKKDPYFELTQAQMYLMENRIDDGKWLIENVKDMVVYDVEKHVELYCYYLYVTSLLEHSEQYTKMAVEKVTGFFENGHDSWQLLWILFYLKGSLDNNQSVKLIRIKDVFHNGCSSPVMYFEACAILNQQPQLLRVLNKFEIQIIQFGCRYKLISEKLAVQISEVIGNEKVASPVCIELLKKLYAMFENDEILTSLVTHLIRNSYVGDDSFEYYEKGVLRGLRITRLYEYYLASVQKDYNKRIPKVVLMYFQYDSELEYTLRAYLYANILKNKDVYGEIYQAYEKNIELFVYEQLKQEHIDDSLVILYRALWKSQLIDDDNKKFMAKLLFMHKLTCFDKGVLAVSVKHKEQKEPVIYQLVEGQVYIPLYTDGCCVVFICEDGIVRKDSVNYEIEKVFEEMPLKNDIVSPDDENEGIKLYRACSFAARGEYTTESVLNWFDMLDDPIMNREFHMKVNGWIIHFYYEYYSGDDFKDMFLHIIKSGLEVKESKELIETCINFELFKEAFELIKQYGYENIAPSKLFRLTKYMIGINTSEYNQLLVEIGGFIFENRVYDEDILNYMMDYYNGTNDDMYQMWKAALNFSMDVNKFSERVLMQFIFTGEHTGRMTEIFNHYYDSGVRGKIVTAYISYNSYLYLVHHKKANNVVFKAIEDAFKENKELPDTCYIAWLKHMTEIDSEKFTDERKINAQKIIDILCRDNKIYAFYKKLEKVIDMPYNAIDKTVIEFYANPDSKVEIHYTYETGEDKDYNVEIMQPSAGGIFTKAFTLLYGDKITYYFTVTGAKEDETTEKFSYECGELNPEQSENRYDYINDCLASRELHDMVTMKKMMRNYSVKNYITKQLFKPMKG